MLIGLINLKHHQLFLLVIPSQHFRISTLEAHQELIRLCCDYGEDLSVHVEVGIDLFSTFFEAPYIHLKFFTYGDVKFMFSYLVNLGNCSPMDREPGVNEFWVVSTYEDNSSFRQPNDQKHIKRAIMLLISWPYKLIIWIKWFFVLM